MSAQHPGDLLYRFEAASHGAEAPVGARYAVLALLQHPNQCNAGQHDTRILERFESEHSAHTKLQAAVILFHDVVQVIAAADLYRVSHLKLNSFRMPMPRQRLPEVI